MTVSTVGAVGSRAQDLRVQHLRPVHLAVGADRDAERLNSRASARSPSLEMPLVTMSGCPTPSRFATRRRQAIDSVQKILPLAASAAIALADSPADRSQLPRRPIHRLPRAVLCADRSRRTPSRASVSSAQGQPDRPAQIGDLQPRGAGAVEVARPNLVGGEVGPEDLVAGNVERDAERPRPRGRDPVERRAIDERHEAGIWCRRRRLSRPASPASPPRRDARAGRPARGRIARRSSPEACVPGRRSG